MHFAALLASAALLLAEAQLGASKATAHLPHSLRRRHHLDPVSEAAGRILRREAQNSSSTTSNSNSISVSAPSATMNQTIATACVDKMGQLGSVANEAGLTACYNVMQYDARQIAFEADLRLYRTAEPTGRFAGIAVNDIMISLTYPASTMFQSITKRSVRMLPRQAGPIEVQQYNLFGTFEKNLDLAKLNDTQLMSLMLPEIQLNAVNASQTPVSTRIDAADGAWFVVGAFQGEFQESLVTPTVAAVAITAAAPFVLPGVHLGIFPTGLIVTAAWTVLFLVAYGIGTLGRIRYRDAYRKRKAALAGRTGKRL